MSVFTGLFGRAFVVLMAALALLAGGYRWGMRATDNAWKAQALQTERAANTRMLREFDRGQVATASLGAALQAQGADYSKLERAYRDIRNHSVPLVVAGVPDAAPAVADAPPGGGAAPGCAIVVVPAPGAGVAADPAVLTAAAVWMWNSALAGADRPAGACGLADTSEGACAVATSLTLDDAWANHTENARTCAQDRLQHQRLIDFVLMRPTP